MIFVLKDNNSSFDGVAVDLYLQLMRNDCLSGILNK